MSKFSRATARVECMSGDLEGLDHDQIQALHVMKHEFLTSLYRLYMVIDAKQADPIVAARLNEILGTLSIEQRS